MYIIKESLGYTALMVVPRKVHPINATILASNTKKSGVHHSQKFRTMSGVTYVATFNAVIGSRLFRKQVTLAPLPTSKL